MKLIFGILAASLAWGQATLSFSPAAASVKAGGTGSVAIQLQYPAGATPSAVQWTLNGQQPLGSFVGTVGAGAQQASKQLGCNPSAAQQICIVYGLNNTVISQNAQLAVYTYTVPATLTPGTIVTVKIATNSFVIADKTGAGVPVAATLPAFTITVAFDPLDVTRDGKVDSADVTAAVNQILGRDQAGNPLACTTADVNGDQACDVRDFQLVANQAFSLSVARAAKIVQGLTARNASQSKRDLQAETQEQQRILGAWKRIL